MMLAASGAAASCDPSAWRPGEAAAWAAALAGLPHAVAAGDATDYAPFVAAVLTCPDLAGALPRPGLRLRGARIGRLDLAGRDIGAAFGCRECWIAALDARDARWARGLDLGGAVAGTIDLRGAEIAGDLSLRGLSAARDDAVSVALDGAHLARAADLSGARLQGGFSARAARIGGDLDMGGAAVQAGAALDGATVGGGATFIRATVGGVLGAEGAVIGGALRADALTAEALRMEGLRTGGAVVLSGATIAGAVDLDTARIGGDLRIRTFEGAPAPHLGVDGAAVALSLNNAHVGGRIDVAGARFGGGVSLDAARIAEDLWLRRGSAVDGPVVAVFARFGQNVDVSGAALGDVDLTGAAIGGELRLGAPAVAPRGSAPDGGAPGLPAPDWRGDARLWLRNASATAIVDTGIMDTGADCAAIDAWPGALDLSGFAYARIGGLGGDDERARERCGFHVAWLSRQTPFSLDPYRRLADLLDAGGRAQAARAVRWAARERQLAEAEGLEWVRLGLQRIFVGYGIYSYTVFVWMIAMAVVGGAIFSRSPEARRSEVPLGVLFSADALLPFVSFRKAHDAVDFTSGYRWYFYFHKFMGWVFALFFVSALGGLFAV
jgi:hypothetical protein